MSAALPNMPKVSSRMTGKLQGIHAINTNTVTNDFCNQQKETDTICGECYSHHMLNTFRKMCQPAWQHNSEVLSSVILQRHELPRITAAFCRFHAHGELINHKHFINFVNIARDNPHCTFALWTKRKDIVWQVLDEDYHSKPSNLILVWSNPKIDKVVQSVPRHFDKVFNNVRHDRTPQNCTGQKCIECLRCYKHDADTDIIVEAVKSGTGRVPKSVTSNDSGVTINV